jgi:hypothetical protein
MATAEARAALRKVNAAVDVSPSPEAFAAAISRERAVWSAMKSEVLSLPRI